jgi:hypothetical protein
LNLREDTLIATDRTWRVSVPRYTSPEEKGIGLERLDANQP